MRARLIRTSDDAELYAHAWNYAGPRHSLFRWAADNGALLRSEMDRGVERLAGEMVHHLFAAAAPSLAARQVIDGTRAPPTRESEGPARSRP